MYCLMVFDLDKAKREAEVIKLKAEGKGRKYPVFRFYNAKREYNKQLKFYKRI